MIVQNAFPEVIDALSTAQKFVYWVPGSSTPPTVHTDLTILAIVGNLVALDNTNREFPITMRETANEMNAAYSNIIYGVVTNVEAGMVMVGYDYDDSFRAYYASARIIPYMKNLMNSMRTGELKPDQLINIPNGLSYNFALLIYFAHAQYHAVHDREGYYSSFHVIPEPGRSKMAIAMAEQGLDFTDPTIIPIAKHNNTIEDEKLALGYYKIFPGCASTEVKNDQGFDFSFSRLPKESITPKNVTAPPQIVNRPPESEMQNLTPEASVDENAPTTDQEQKFIPLPAAWLNRIFK